MTARNWLIALVVALGGGFIAGRWSIPRGKPIPLVVGSAEPLPERNLSPEGQVRTVIITRTVPGPPAAPPVAMPPDLGQHLQTTDTTLPALAQGAVLHDALFGKINGSNLVLRNVQWMNTPTGPASIGDTRTVTATTTLTLPAPPAPPHWSAVALAGLQDGRVVYGGAVGYWRGPVGIQAGTIGNVAFVGGGFRW